MHAQFTRTSTTTMASNGARFTAEAEKALARTTIFGFGKAQKFQDAAEAFQKAGNAYKLTAEYTQAGQAFLRASDCFEKAESGNSDVLTALVEAGNCFKMGNDLQRAVDVFSRAIMAYEEAQRFGQCARYQKEVAEMYEGSGDINSAIVCYQKVISLNMYVVFSIKYFHCYHNCSSAHRPHIITLQITRSRMPASCI